MVGTERHDMVWRAQKQADRQISQSAQAQPHAQPGNDTADLDRQIAELEGQISTAMEAGQGSPDYSAFYKSPGYDFRFQEGANAIDKSAAARGKLMSGGIARELTRYGQGFASGEFNNYANRLASMAGIGQTAAAATGQLGSAAAGQYGAQSRGLSQTIMSGGQAQASGIVGANNAWAQGLQGAAGAVQRYGSQQGWGGVY